MPVIRTGRKPVSIAQALATGFFAARAATLTGSGSQFVSSSYGPTGGAQAIRDAAGVRAGNVTEFTTSHTTFTSGMTRAAIQADIDANLTGGRYWWSAGTYRPGSPGYVFGVAGQEHRFEDGAIVKGSSVVSPWTQGTGVDAGKWFPNATQTQNFDANDQTSNVTDNPLAGSQMEAYYSDDVMLYPVASKSAVAGRADAVFFDNTNDNAWIGFNPSGHTIERLTYFGFLVRVTAANVTIKGGKFTQSGFACIRWDGLTVTQPNQPNGGVIEDAEICYNRRGPAIDAYGWNPPSTTNPRIHGLTFTHLTIHHGANYNYIVVATDDLVIQDCEMYAGNFMHFGDRNTDQFAEGNDKILWTERAIIRRNWIYGADGAGSWPDTQNNNFTLEDNVIEDNWAAGIHLEDNNVALIQRNYFSNNSRDGNQPAPYQTLGGWGYKGGGVFLSTTANAEVTRNDFRFNKKSALYMRHDDTPNPRIYRLEGTWFHDNLVYHTDSDSAFEYVITYRDSDPFVYTAAANNKFDNNVYHVKTGGRSNDASANWFFAPSGSNRTFTQWKAGLITANGTYAPASFHDPNSTLVADS